MSNGRQQLFWAVATPIRYLGFTIDEWAVLALGIVPGLFLLNTGLFKSGLLVIISGITLCMAFKKFKRMAKQFRLRSFLVAKGFLTPPPMHPNTLNKQVGR